MKNKTKFYFLWTLLLVFKKLRTLLYYSRNKIILIQIKHFINKKNKKNCRWLKLKIPNKNENKTILINKKQLFFTLEILQIIELSGNMN